MLEGKATILWDYSFSNVGHKKLNNENKSTHVSTNIIINSGYISGKVQECR